MLAQLSIFEEVSSNVPVPDVKDVRTENQIGKNVAYDVGEKILYSRKELHSLKESFQQCRSQERLRDLENTSSSVAAEMITKKELFSSFSLEDEKNRGVDAKVAKCKQLIIQRISTAPNNDMSSRAAFLKASTQLLDLLSECTTWEQFSSFVAAMNKQLYLEDRGVRDIKSFIHELKEKIEVLQHSEELDKESKLKYLFRRKEEAQIRYQDIEKARESYFRILGEKYASFFLKRSSRDSTLKIVAKIKSWDDLIKSKQKRITKGNGPVWQRTLPERPDRTGGRINSIERPEDLVSRLKFRGCQFGHYVDDRVGLEHLSRFYESVVDLSDLLGVDEEVISLGKLGIAFGARGRGKALGHFEPDNLVINFTKEKGSLGVAAHELAHFFDCMLFEKSHSGNHQGFGYLSDLSNNGAGVPTTLLLAMGELMTQIKEGEAIAYYQNENGLETRWTIGGELKSMYSECKGNILEVMKKKHQKLKNEKEYALSQIRYFEDEEKVTKRLNSQLTKRLKKFSQALAWYHERETGERLDVIAYPSDKSEFMRTSIALDRGKEGKYWSSNRELFARCFEAWVEDQLIKKNRRSDYLVAGTNNSAAYPVGKERKEINIKMNSIVNELVECLFNKGRK